MRQAIPSWCRARPRVSPPIPAPMMMTSMAASGPESRPRSGVAALLAEKAELLLHRPVGIAEQHGLVRGLVGDPRPARHDKDVVRLPGEDLVADPAFTRALDRDEHRAIGRA